MTDKRTDPMLEILKSIQSDIRDIKLDLSPLTMRVSALEDQFRGTLTTLHSIQGDVSHLKRRVDRIEERLGLRDTEH